MFAQIISVDEILYALSQIITVDKSFAVIKKTRDYL
jgi:hypothetical protein